MNKFFQKYFLDTNRYVMSFFFIGWIILAVGVSISWSKRLGGYGWVIYLILVALFVLEILKNVRKSKSK